MDELDLIRSFRTDVPARSASARRRGLAELGAAGGRRRPPRRVLLPIAGAAAAATVVAVVLGGSSGDGLTPDATAAERLREAAAVAESRPDPRAIGAGQFWYQRSIEAYLTTTGGAASVDGAAPPTPAFSLIQPHVREQWIGRDGGGRVRTRLRGEPRFPGPRDRERWQAAGSPDLGGEMDLPLVNEDAPPPGAPGFSLGQEAISYEQLLDLPTDADRLYQRLRRAAERGGGSGPDDELFTIVGDLLRAAPIPSDLRGALYRVAARVPRIRAVGEVRDAAGRRGVGIGRDDQGVRSILIFDPATAELLGEEDVLLEGAEYVDAAPGTVIGEAAYLEAGVVDSTRARP